MQFHGIKGHDVEQFRELATQTVLFLPGAEDRGT
jgi:hypothetical protein